jgi:uncharacterized OB-fold protein
MNEDAFVILPELTEYTEAFWTGGEHGELRIYRCEECRYWFHPPRPRCPACLSGAVGGEATSGLGVVHSYTVNVKQWNPTWEHPYVFASIELEEGEDLRVTSNLRNCEPDAVEIGMPVEVYFERHDDVWLPLFQPREAVDG